MKRSAMRCTVSSGAGMARLASGSRTAKYRHLLAEALPMDDGEEAILAVLMLRGPQTPGELKQRGDRMHPFADLDDVHRTLERLIERDLVVRLARRPGQKEERYSHLLGDEDGEEARPEPPPEPIGTPAPDRNGSPPSDMERRLGELERRVALLEARSGTTTAQRPETGGEL